MTWQNRGAMDNETITRKQLSAAVTVSLLSPLLRLLPQTAVGFAGRAAWMGALTALVPLTALGLVMASFRRRLRPGEGMGGLLLRWLGPVAGRIVLCLYGAWFLFYGGFILRSGAERLVSTIYPSSGQDLFLLVTIGLCLAVSLGALRAAARAAVIMRAVLTGALVLVLALSLPNMDAAFLGPIGARDVLAAVPGALPFASVCAVAACFSFLEGYARPPKGRLWPAGAALLVLGLGAAVCLAVVCVFGPALAGTLTYPFFVMIRGISLWDLVPRIEAAVIAVWVGADFMLVTMLLRCAHEALRPVFGYPVPDGLPAFSLGKGRWLQWLEGLAVLGCSALFDLPPWQLKLWSDRYIPLCSDVMLYGGFGLLWLVTLPQRKNERRITQNESTGGGAP